MARGIAFDRYEVPRGGFGGAPSARLPGPDSTIADLLGTTAKIAKGIEGAAADSMAKANALKTKVRVGERYLTAVEEMDKQFVAIENSPDREKATEVWGKYIEDRLPSWQAGLNEEAALALRERLVPKRAEYGHRARVLEIKDLQDRTNTVILGHAKSFVDAFARSGPDGPEETREFELLKEAYGHAIASNAKDRKVAATELLSHRQEASAAKAHAMIESGNPGSLLKLRDLIAQEEEKPGSTFLKYVDPDRRNAIKKAMRSEDEQLRRRRIEDADRARDAMARAIKQQQEEWERRSDTMLVQGTITESWIEDGKRLGLASDEKARFYREAVEKRRTGEIGPNDEPTFRRLSLDVWSETSNPSQTLAAVKTAFADRRLNYPTMREWASHLETRIERAKTTTSKEETQLDKERTEVQGWIDILTTTRSPFEKFDPAANRLKLSLRTELGKLPREQSAKEWYFKNESQFYGRMRGLATGFIRTERAAMNIPEAVVPPMGVAPADVIAAKRAEYQKKFGAEWREKMVDDIERLQRMQELQGEIDEKKPAGAGTPGPKPSASTDPRGPDRPAPQKPAEKKSGGPLQPNRRAY